MFRERIANWAGILDLFQSKWNTIELLTRVSGSLVAGTYQSKRTVTHTRFDPSRDMSIATAIAYAQLARCNH